MPMAQGDNHHPTARESGEATGLLSDQARLTHWRTPVASDRGSGKAKRMTSDEAKLTHWPTPTVYNTGRTPEEHEAKSRELVESGTRALGMPLAVAAQMASWPTPNAGDSNPRSLGTWKIPAKGQVHAQQLSPWPTPITTDAIWRAEHVSGDRMDSLIRCAVGSGTGASGSPAATEKPGQLNPELSRWLMGFPAGWSCSGATGTRSCRRSRRRSSRR
jgi:hypothetical protein